MEEEGGEREEGDEIEGRDGGGGVLRFRAVLAAPRHPTDLNRHA